MPWSAVHEALKFWLPVISAFLLVIKGWKTLVRKLTEWTEKLLNNHLHHIEINTAAAVELLRELPAEFKTLRGDQAISFMDIRRDLTTVVDTNNKVQQAILTNLEILKDRG